MDLTVCIGALLQEKGWMMGTAESCTGGNIAHQITQVAGCSTYFAGGIISYTNDVKMHVLGVSAADLDAYGAVSQPVVEQMVSGALRQLNCQCAVATSGIAGPGGGTTEKPVGTVWIAAAIPGHKMARCFHFGNERTSNIQQATEIALRMLLDLLTESTKS